MTWSACWQEMQSRQSHARFLVDRQVVRVHAVSRCHDAEMFSTAPEVRYGCLSARLKGVGFSPWTMVPMPIL
ncbi:MAG: hypothetical protein JWO80_6303 [Bryobacterales bacterium]|nr:hypothetical protein [Bryobacterales bacterium]